MSEQKYGMVCEHGSLKRQCLVCELTEERDRLLRELESRRHSADVLELSRLREDFNSLAKELEVWKIAGDVAINERNEALALVEGARMGLEITASHARKMERERALYKEYHDAEEARCVCNAREWEEMSQDEFTAWREENEKVHKRVETARAAVSKFIADEKEDAS